MGKDLVASELIPDDQRKVKRMTAHRMILTKKENDSEQGVEEAIVLLYSLV